MQNHGLVARATAMEALIFNNAIAWGHFKVRGGWPNHLWSTGIYFVLLSSIIFVTARLNPMGNVLIGWTTAVLGLQLAILILYGCSMVGNAVRRDISSGLLESHRLMPVPAGAAVTGYLLGPTYSAMMLAGVNLIIGTTTGTLGGVPMEKWFTANAVTALFVVFLWIAIAFSAFLAKNAFGMVLGLMFPAMMSGGAVVSVVPALSVLISPLMGNSIFGMFWRGGGIPASYPWSFAAQFVFGAIFFRGAMRRYRRDDVPALGVVLGLMLLAAWVATSAVAVLRWEDVRPTWGPPTDINRGLQMISALLTSALIGLVAVGGSSRAAVEWMRTLIVTGQRPRRRPAPPPLIACAAVAVVLVLVAVSPPPELPRPQALVHVGVVLLAFLLSMSYLLRIFYRAGRKAVVVGIAWIIVTWLMPMGIDAIRQTMLPKDSPPVFSLGSPLGTLIDLWSDRPTGAIGGLIFQAVFAGIPAVLFYLTEPKRRAETPLIAPGPGADASRSTAN
jgi:hypothetical protein